MIPEWLRQRRLALPIELEVFKRANEVRLEHGCPVVEWDDRLFAAAREHSSTMCELGFCGHDSPLPGRESPLARAVASGARFAAVGENVLFHERAVMLRIAAVKFTLRSSSLPASVQARTLVKQWFDSPAHQSNLLTKSWTRTGVGVAIAPSGRVYATQLFAC